MSDGKVILLILIVVGGFIAYNHFVKGHEKEFTIPYACGAFPEKPECGCFGNSVKTEFKNVELNKIVYVCISK